MEDSVKNDSTEELNQNDVSNEVASPQDEAKDFNKASGDRLSEEAQNKNDSMDNLMDMYEESFKRFQEGEVVTGRIISIEKEEDKEMRKALVTAEDHDGKRFQTILDYVFAVGSEREVINLPEVL